MDLGPDAHGQAALMLCESLLLVLIEQRVLTKESAMQAISDVIDVKHVIAGDTESIVVSMTSIGLLRAVSQSISASAVAANG